MANFPPTFWCGDEKSRWSTRDSIKSISSVGNMVIRWRAMALNGLKGQKATPVLRHLRSLWTKAPRRIHLDRGCCRHTNGDDNSWHEWAEQPLGGQSETEQADWRQTVSDPTNQPAYEQVPDLCVQIREQEPRKVALSASKKGFWDSVSTAGGSSKSKFFVLAYNSEDEQADMELLKVQIRTISCGPTSGGHEKACIKLKRGLHTRTGLKSHYPANHSPSSTKGTQSNESKPSQSFDGPHPSILGGQPANPDAQTKDCNGAVKGPTQPKSKYQPISSTKIVLLKQKDNTTLRTPTKQNQNSGAVEKDVDLKQRAVETVAMPLQKAEKIGDSKHSQNTPMEVSVASTSKSIQS